MVDFYGQTFEGLTGTSDDPLFVNFATAFDADAQVLRWHTPDASRVTLASGRVAVLNNRKTGGSPLSQASAGQQPLYNAKGTVGAPNGKPFMSFVQARSDYFLSTGLPNGAGASWWFALPIRVPAFSANRYILGGQADLTGTHFLRVLTGNQLRLSVGVNGATSANATVNYTADAWAALYGTWNGSLGRAALSFDGVTFTSDTQASAVSNAASRNIGGAIGNGGTGVTLAQTFDLADLLSGPGDLMDGTSPMNATLARLRAYMLSRHNLGPG